PLIASGVAFLAVVLSEPAPAAQAPSHIVIPFLANTANVADLNFEGAECDVEQSGNRMVCSFQQVFLTTSPVAPDTCLITTNSYERSFRRESASHWSTTDSPNGPCGVQEVVT